MIMNKDESQRLSNIALISQALADPTLTTHERSLLESSRKSAINRRSLSVRVNDFVSGVFSPNTIAGTRHNASMTQIDSTMQDIDSLMAMTIESNNSPKSPRPTRSNLWFFLALDTDRIQ
jgi:hypothetical protein